MRVVLQRVSSGKCIVKNTVVSSIGKGYMLLVGFCKNDDEAKVFEMARKINNLRLFDDELGKINLNIHQVNGEILSISQFTLYADLHKSNRPSFTQSLEKDKASALYLLFNETLKNTWNINVKPGCFGEHMDLDIVCDGPVTITLEL